MGCSAYSGRRSEYVQRNNFPYARQLQNATRRVSTSGWAGVGTGVVPPSRCFLVTVFHTIISFPTGLTSVVRCISLLGLACRDRSRFSQSATFESENGALP